MKASVASGESAGPGERGLDWLRARMSAETAASFASCTNCGLCSEGCVYTLASDQGGDPRFSPIYKLEPMRRLWRQEFQLSGRLLRWLGMEGMREEALASFGRWVFGSCSLCGHCSLICPAGIDLVALLRTMRGALTVSGHAPAALTGADRSGSDQEFGWSEAAVLIRQLEREHRIVLPVDREGVDYLVLFSALEWRRFPNLVVAVARILERAGVTWTLSSEVCDGDHPALQLGGSDLAVPFIRRIMETVERLQAGSVVVAECSHCYQALRWEGPNWVERVFGFKVFHLVEVMDRLRQEGRLPLGSKERRVVAYHDPCHLARLGGVIREPRRLLKGVATVVRELSPIGVNGRCCGGGGGMNRLRETVALRRRVFHRQRIQLERMEVEVLVTACSTCRETLGDRVGESGMEVVVMGLTELMAAHLDDGASLSLSPEVSISPGGE